MKVAERSERYDVWRRLPLKRLLAGIEQGWSPQCDSRPADPGEWGVLKAGCVNGGVFRPEENKALPPDELPITRYAIRPGDVLMSRANTRELLGSAALAKQAEPRLLLCDKLYRLRVATGALDARFLTWWLMSAEARAQMERDATGASGSMQNIGQDTVLNLALAVPTIDIQRAIADFLDRKTAAIDALIEKKERLVALLQEKRQALITQAVTRGLDSTAPMKDSGIEWLGQIPAHWEVKRLKHVMQRIVDCPHATPEYSADGAFPVVRTADLEPGRLLLSCARRVDESVYRDRTARMVPRVGDILYSREGERFGMAALVPADVRVCLGQRMMIFRAVEEAMPDFMMWALNSNYLLQQVRQDTVGATSPRINIPTIANAWLAVPPVGEQRAIVDRVARQTGALDAAGNKVRAHTALLREYRQALITAAVTGKLDITAMEAA